MRRRGLDPASIAACAARVTIPRRGPVQSLNVAQAAAVLFHALQPPGKGALRALRAQMKAMDTASASFCREGDILVLSGRLDTAAAARLWQPLAEAARGARVIDLAGPAAARTPPARRWW